MAANPETRRRTLPSCRLELFDPAFADTVMSWVHGPREAQWLAPRSTPPLSAEEVLNWQRPGHEAHLLMEQGRAAPVGYGELNVLTGHDHRYWLGHLIVDPEQRGRGCGVQLTRLLLWRAFALRGATDVTLVVFPENKAAIACYRAAGMRGDGYESHDFPAYGPGIRLLRMVATGVV